ncbi:kinase-like domain-containing protein, partial [Cladorrhinum sp. PSN259]
YPEVEYLANYSIGGLHPVQLGDRIGPSKTPKRFRIIHKLGNGSFGTVWLCRDEQHRRWRAVKVLSADSSKSNNGESELKIFDQFFRGVDYSAIVQNGIQAPIESFRFRGPNGEHLCIVMPLLGPSLENMTGYYGHLPGLVRDISFQLIRAVEFMHRHRVCHGDFRPSNILFRLVDEVNSWSEQQMMQVLGKPVILPVRALRRGMTLPRGIPPYLVENAAFRYDQGVCSTRVVVVDFGLAWGNTEVPSTGTGMPPPYAAPEDCFGLGGLMSYKADIWSLGATVAHLAAGHSPFGGNSDDAEYNPRESMTAMEQVMGPMPQPYRRVWVSLPDIPYQVPDDEKKFASVTRNLYTPESGTPAFLLGWLNAQRPVSKVTMNQATDIMTQYKRDPSRLPYFYRQQGADDGNRALVLASQDPRLYNFLTWIFRWMPNTRPYAHELRAHPWFAQK